MNLRSKTLSHFDRALLFYCRTEPMNKLLFPERGGIQNVFNVGLVLGFTSSFCVIQIPCGETKLFVHPIKSHGEDF